MHVLFLFVMTTTQVETDSARIAKEEIECQAIATDAQADLDVALPALERAMAEVRKSSLDDSLVDTESCEGVRRGHGGGMWS